MKKCTKVLSVLLVLILALGTMSMVAFAVDTTAVATNLRWDENGKAMWDAVDGAVGYSLYLYQDGVEKPLINSNGTSKALASTMKTYGSGSYTFAVKAKFSGSTYGPLSEQSAPFVYTAPAKPITTVQLTGVEVPADGMPASYACVAPAGAGYTVAAKYWAETDAIPTTVEGLLGLSYTNAEFNFSADKYYVFAAELKADEGYKFEDSMTAKINFNDSTKFVKVDDNTVQVCLAFTVKPAVVTGIEIISAPKNVSYKVGEMVSTEGLQVVASYTNGKTADVSDKVKVTNFNTDEIGENREAKVEYTENGVIVSATFNYSVKEAGGVAVGGIFETIINFFSNLIGKLIDLIIGAVM